MRVAMTPFDILREPGLILPEVEALRRELHRHPEVRFQEQWTSDRISDYLTASGVVVKRGFARGTGVVGEITGTSGRTIALRSDMDGLEAQEDTGLPYASEIPGRMHACGHDGHMAMLCGAARILARHALDLDCTVRLIFQPAEELGMGGKMMVDEGVLEGVEAVFGLHDWPTLPVGKVGLKSGWAMAGADWFKIVVQGKGCHGADPASGVDPILTAAHLVQGLYSITGRDLDRHETAVLSVGSIHGGGASNIIPESVELEGSFRTFSTKTREKICAAIIRLADGAASMFGAHASVAFDENAYLPLHNDPGACSFARKAIHAGLGDDIVMDISAPSMASEDFAFYLKHTPGAFLWLGTKPAGRETPPLHNPGFDFNDDALATGMGVWLSLVAAFSAGQSPGTS